MNTRTEEEFGNLTKKKRELELTLPVVSREIEELKHQMISNQALLQNHKNTLRSLIQSFDHEVQSSLPAIDGDITEDVLSRIQEVIEQKQQEYQKQLEEQESKLKESRSERDQLIRAAQAIEMESELTKRTIQFDINELQHAILKIEKHMNVRYLMWL